MHSTAPLLFRSNPLSRYWDWATNSNVPAAAREPKINVSLPEKANGPVVTRQIDNPLYSYKFQKASRLVRDFTPVINAEANDAWQDKNPMRPNTMVSGYSIVRS
jgi:hypothetical protein